ncbi:OX-2 membrane glycoprotein-like isoform X1 [Acipenser ruthenus]|uniref:OX-2 membrane glycoprotein-like isoform X1 n=1 Tax=Acipenser ruthenus TaxID=7906 RepID=UPI001561AAEF|nr:OX-2 membrane glycoprotein-like isoform X1 [Acipenser ruthenus]
MMDVSVRYFTLLMLVVLTGCTGTTVTVQSDGSTAVLNKDFTFRCSLSDPKVKQVTWQKQKDKALENVATYSVTFGAKVLEPYHQRVNFSLLGLHESSITIHNVQPEDEGCYMCLFNTYPQGSITGRSCFTVLGVSEIHIETISTESENTAVVSCSATGKPAPKIRWNASESVTSNAVQSSVDHNGNGIVTVTSNLTLDLSSFPAEEISCFVSHSTLNEEVEKNITIREDKRTLTNVRSPGVVVLVILCIAALIIVTVACFIIRKRKKTKAGPLEEKLNAGEMSYA